MGSSLIPDWWTGDTGEVREQPPLDQTINFVMFNAWLLGNLLEVVQLLRMVYKWDLLKWVARRYQIRGEIKCHAWSPLL